MEQGRGLDDYLFPQVFSQETLNGFMALGRPAWTEARQLVQRVLSKDQVRIWTNNADSI